MAQVVSLVALLWLWTPIQAESFNPEYFLNGTVDFASAFDKRGLP